MTWKPPRSTRGSAMWSWALYRGFTWMLERVSNAKCPTCGTAFGPCLDLEDPSEIFHSARVKRITDKMVSQARVSLPSDETFLREDETQ